MYQHGWFQIAFVDELQEGVTPVTFGDRRLAAVKDETGVRVIDATCPHRGAHLGYGGKLAKGAITCAFHGFQICIGETQGPYRVQEYETFVCEGLVFVRLSPSETPDLPAALQEIARDYVLVPGLNVPVNTTVAMATENAIDSSHFKEVHGLAAVPNLSTRYGEFGELIGEGTFMIPTPFSQAKAGFITRIFSPGVVISRLCGDEPYNYVIISAAVPGESPGTCVIRLSVGIIPPPDKEADREFAQFLINDSRRGLELDCAIWNHLAIGHEPQWAENDRPAIEFASFCERFQD